MPCPNCSQLLVRFRDKLIALNKELLMNGSKEERTFHLAEVISEFMDQTGLNFDMITPHMMDEAPVMKQQDEDEKNKIIKVNQHHKQVVPEPISDDETQRFVDFELNAIDNMEYFKKHLE